MKLILLVAALAVAHGAKLERAYLPPSYARTSGGSGNILETPFAGPKNTEAIFNPNFAQSVNAQTDNKFAQQASQIGNDNARFGDNGFRGDNARFGDNAQFERQYVQSGNGFAQTQYDARPERAQAALERNAAILRNDNSNDGETFSYAFETENGIYAEESGVATNGVEAQGGYSYTGDDGRVYSVRYTADQNGFVPQGDHLPTPPPIPEEILKALEQNARDEAAGIYDDGSYNEAKYTESQSQYNQNQYAQPAANLNYEGDDDTVVTNSALPSSRNIPLGQSNLGSPASPQNAYLPPLAQRNSLGRRQSFDRNGYRY